MSYGYGLSASLFQMARSYTVFAHNGQIIPATMLKTDAPAAVSYTHLRAHETVLDLVCRLLLEKKKHKKTHLPSDARI